MKVTANERLMHNHQHIEPGEVVDLPKDIVTALGGAVTPMGIASSSSSSVDETVNGGTASPDVTDSIEDTSQVTTTATDPPPVTSPSTPEAETTKKGKQS